MTLHYYLKSFNELLSKQNLQKNIDSIIQGGSSVYNEEAEDIDLLLLCMDNLGNEVYNKLMNYSKKNKEITKKFDVKIIEKHQLKFINNSSLSPFLYHFVKNSVVIKGMDLRGNIKLNETILHQIIVKDLEQLDKIRDSYYFYNSENLAKIQVYEIAKRLVVIQDILKSDIQNETSSITLHLKEIYLNQFKEIRNLVKKKRSWISICIRNTKNGSIGFNKISQKITLKKEIQRKTINCEFEKSISRIKELGKKSVELIGL